LDRIVWSSMTLTTLSSLIDPLPSIRIAYGRSLQIQCTIDSSTVCSRLLEGDPRSDIKHGVSHNNHHMVSYLLLYDDERNEG
ncbi:hypothetical protein PMAYCL1PPCAC_24521, partial [Pristionchus mayeri]